MKTILQKLLLIATVCAANGACVSLQNSTYPYNMQISDCRGDATLVGTFTCKNGKWSKNPPQKKRASKTAAVISQN